MGLNSTLATAGRSLEVFTAGIQVASQNISNAGTPGYIREEVQLAAGSAYRKGNLVFGTGVDAQGIVQKIDSFLEQRIYGANTDAAGSGIRQSIYEQLEIQIGELGDTDLSSSISGFLAAVQDAVNQPESPGMRDLVISGGTRLASDIESLRSRVDQLNAAQAANIQHLTAEANDLITEVASLNKQIASVEKYGLNSSEAGGLRTQRLTALNRLSEIIPVTVVERPDQTVDLFSGSEYLILGSTTQHLEVHVAGGDAAGGVAVRTTGTKATIPASSSGEIGGHLSASEEILGGFADQLDQYAAALIYEFNRIHSSGEGTAGYTSITSQEGVLDTGAALNSAQAGLAFTPEHGQFELKVVNTSTGIAQSTTIAVDLDGIGTDTTLDDLRAAIDAVGNVNASVTTDGHLRLTADSGFEIRFGDDSSGVLAALGINTFFTGSDAATIGVNSQVAANQGLLATGRGGGPADGSNMLALAGITTQPFGSLEGLSLDDFYERMITGVAQGSATESTLAESFGAYRDSLMAQRMQFSGVSLDEEAIRLLEFQRMYQSAAKVISTVDELMSVLLGL